MTHQLIEGTVTEVKDLGDNKVYIKFMEQTCKDHTQMQSIVLSISEYLKSGYAIGDRVYMTFGNVFKE